MSLEELNKLDTKALQERESALRLELFKSRIGSATEKVKDVSQFKKKKKDIARILTLISQRAAVAG